MKASGGKLKKLKTKQVYGFKKDYLGGGGGNGDPTILITTTISGIVINIPCLS